MGPVLSSQLTIWRQVFLDVLRSGTGKYGLIVIGLFIVIAVFAPLIAPYDPIKVRSGSMAMLSLQEPGASHLMGTDLLGRDIMSRIVYGARVSLTVGLLSVLIMLALGAVMGILSGYHGGWLDALIMRTTDIFLAFPIILGSILLLTILGSGVSTVVIVLASLGWPAVARVFRSTILSVREKEFVESARAAGETDLSIMLRHVLPNAVGPVVVLGAISVGDAILAESALSFFGIGVQPPTPDWGYMIAESRSYAMTAPWLIFFPGMALAVIVSAFIMLGDAIRDALDERKEY